MEPIHQLPIDAFLEAIHGTLKKESHVIVRAEPGAGKTTRLPRSLLSLFQGQILVLEPRRLAARMAATRVAQELGDPIGRTVGYQTRFDSQKSGETRLLYLTEGLFVNIVQENPRLEGISAVILDEFHERHLQGDLALALTLDVQRRVRPDLKLVIMSATLDLGPLAQHLAPAQVFDIPGRTYPVAMEYHPPSPEDSLEEAIRKSVRKMLGDSRCPHNILVFLSGMAEIVRCALLLEREAHLENYQVFCLSAEIKREDVDRIFDHRDRRMIVLSTNVAETSVTLPMITGVIDVGFAKIAGHAAWSGMPTLEIKRISQASAIQRAGRAGRSAPGVAYRLYSEADFRARPSFLTPEIQRLDLTSLTLSVFALKPKESSTVPDLSQALPWFEAPRESMATQARHLLTLLGALDDQGMITTLGRRMASIPLHPRLARAVLEGLGTPHAAEILLAACLLNEGLPLDRGARSERHHHFAEIVVQVGSILAPREAGERMPLRPGLDEAKVRQIILLFRSLARKLGLPFKSQLMITDDDLARSLLSGFPDRVAKLRAPLKGKSGSEAKVHEYNLVGGGGGTLAARPGEAPAPWILALDAEELPAKAASVGVSILTHTNLPLPLDLTLLKERGPGFYRETVEAFWQEDGQRVDLVQRTSYGPLVISEVRLHDHAAHAQAISQLLLKKLQEYWPKPFADSDDLESYHKRASLLREQGLEPVLPIFEGEMLEILQFDLCQGCRSFKEITAQPLMRAIYDQLSWAERDLLDRETPREIALANGRRFTIFYKDHRDPYISGYIQDFFGLKDNPSLILGRVPLAVELKGPNQRPLQMTRDLEGFWQRSYPAIRGELGRLYPRHHWPENPKNAPPILHKSRLPNSTH